MKLSSSSGYGLISVAYIAQHCKKGPVLAQRPAKEFNIPVEYLLKFLHDLVKAGVLRSKRGPRGGFSLAKPAEKITMLEIVEAVEGPLKNYLMLGEQTYNEPFSTKMQKVCDDATKHARAVFEKATLAKMLKR